MNTLDALLSWFAGATLRGLVLALAVLAIQAALRGWLPAPWRYALWLPVVLVCLSPRLPQSRWSVENRFATRTIHVQPSTLPSPFLTTVPDGLRSAEVSTKNWYTPPRTDWRRVAAVTWLAGVAGMLTCAFAAYARTMARMRRGARPPDAALVTMLADMALVAGLRRAPRFLVSTSVESPAVTGFLRPLLLLPTHFPGSFTREEARLVLLHEMTHLKRHDLPLNWLLCLLQAIHWCNPVLWFAFARMRADREAACDSQVLAVSSEDRRADYGHALLKLEGGLAHTGFNLGFLGIFERSGGMRSRIRAIAAYRRTHPAWGILGAALIAALTVAGATRAQNPGTTDFGTSSGFGVTNSATPLAENAGSLPVTPTTGASFETRNSGATVEVEPVIGQDGYTIDLNLLPQVVEFEGFINYGSPIQTTSTNALGEQVVNVITPNVTNQPIFSKRNATTSESVFDGQTVVLGGLMREDGKKIEDKAPLVAQVQRIGQPQKPQPSGAQTASGAGTAEIHRKLNAIIIPRLEFREATIEEAVEYLRRRSVELDMAEPDPGKRGVNIVLKLDKGRRAPDAPLPRGIPGLPANGTIPGLEPIPRAALPIDPGKPRITISLTNIPLVEALKYVTALAGLNFQISPGGVEVVPNRRTVQLLTKEYKVRAELGLKPGTDAKEFLVGGGVVFPSGTSAALSPEGTRLLVRNTQENLDLVDGLLATSAASDTPPQVNSGDSTDPTAKIMRKLNTIIIPRLEFREATTREALDYLKKRSIELDTAESDSAKRGVNIVLQLETPSATAAPPSTPSPSDGRLSISLNNIPLFEALKYVTELASLKFKVEPYAVLVLPVGAGTDVLVTKRWKLDEPIDAKALTAKGVTFPASATATWIPSSQQLIVRNTQENLDLIDALLIQTKQPKAPALPTVQSKAQSMIIPSLEFRETTVREAVDRLKRMSIALDPDGKGINFVCKLDPPEVGQKKITLALTNTTLWNATRAVAEQVGMEVSASPYALYIEPKSSRPPTPR